MNTPEQITELTPDQIFVFGSNLAGEHSGGAALFAKEHFGAEQGIGEGMTGQCYAFPTLSKNLRQRTDDDMEASIQKLYQTAEKNPNKTFLVTRVGCGIAGYPVSYMAFLFRNPPANVVLPIEFTDV